jgi:hypothetical protein
MNSNKVQKIQKGSISEVPAGLKALKAAAEGYKHYIKYLKNGGSSGLSPEFPDLVLTGA